jgi:hypothetical protein
MPPHTCFYFFGLDLTIHTVLHQFCTSNRCFQCPSCEVQVQAQMSLPPRSCFQFFGLDFLIDTALKPWLLEANATPSMKVGGCSYTSELGEATDSLFVPSCACTWLLEANAMPSMKGGAWSVEGRPQYVAAVLNDCSGSQL